jgi:hypothetical protein
MERTDLSMLKQATRLVENVWRVHALYNVVTGVWPILHIRSFEAMSGPKTDSWLVKTVGALVGVIGGVIAMAGARKRITPEVVGLAIGSSASLAAIDVVYVSRGRISRVYLLDAMLEVLLIVGWIIRWMQSRARSNQERSTPVLRPHPARSG